MRYFVVFIVKGFPNASGLIARRGVISDSDADLVVLMKQAGSKNLNYFYDILNFADFNCHFNKTHEC